MDENGNMSDLLCSELNSVEDCLMTWYLIDMGRN